MSDAFSIDLLPSRSTPVRAAILLAALLLHPSAPFADAPFRDPTRPPVVHVDPASAKQAKASSPLALRAIFFAEDRHMAIVNGERVLVGDTVRGARVLSIDRDRVVFLREGKRTELVLVKDVKRPVDGGEGESAPPVALAPERESAAAKPSARQPETDSPRAGLRQLEMPASPPPPPMRDAVTSAQELDRSADAREAVLGEASDADMAPPQRGRAGSEG